MNNPTTPEAPAKLIDARIADLGDWRGKTFARVRALIHPADPEMVEELKWRGVRFTRASSAPAKPTRPS